jgi:hypothetical protein
MAIWSLRLRLHSGLRQSGRRLRRQFVLARLKPCPSGRPRRAKASVVRGRAGASRGVVGLGLWWRGGRQFGRCARGFTPACGRAEPTHRARRRAMSGAPGSGWVQLRIMLKRWTTKYWPMVLFLLLIGAILYMSRRAENRKTQGSGIAQARSTQVPVAPMNTSKIAENAGKSASQPDWTDRFAWPEGTTVCALILTLIVVAWQSTETKDAAEAARLSAQYLVNSERPWIMAEVERDPRRPHFYQIKIRNYGRTPARFLSGDASYTVVKSPDSLPGSPAYSSPMVLPAQLLIAPDNGFPVPHGYSISDLIKDPGSETLIIYGRVLYEDMIVAGSIHETRWCFSYFMTPPNGGEFRLAGPREYTKNS